MTADLPTVPDEVRLRAEELWAEGMLRRNVGVDGLPAVVDFVWAEAFAAGQAAAYEGGETEYEAHLPNAGLTLPWDDAWTGNVNVVKRQRHCSPWVDVPVAADGEVA